MYNYVIKLLEIAINSYDSKHKQLANNYRYLLSRIKNNCISTEDIENIKELYTKGYKQDSFTNKDKQAINKELKELEKIARC